jgi:hypothetical protein
MATHEGRAHLRRNDGHCEVPDCDKPARVQTVNGATYPRRWCSKHAKQRETKAALAKGNLCRVEGCARPVSQSRSLCAMHLQRLRVRGDVMADVPCGSIPRANGATSDFCAVEGCAHLRSRNPSSRYCTAHLWRRKHYGQMFDDIPVPAAKGQIKAAAQAAALVMAEPVITK